MRSDIRVLTHMIQAQVILKDFKWFYLNNNIKDKMKMISTW